MKVAIFTNAYKPISSGVVNTIEFIKNALEKRGHEVYIFAPAFYDYRDSEKNIFRYRSVDLTRKVKFPIAIPFSPEADQIIEEFKPDIIHAHHPFVLGKAACRYARRLGVPLVFTFHTQYEMYTHYVPLPTAVTRYSCRKIVKAFCDRADCITTPARSIAELLRSYGVKRRIEVIPNGIDLSPYLEVSPARVEEIRKEYGLEGKKSIIFVGRIAPEKNLVFLVDSFRMVSGDNPDARLVIVGDGPQLAELKKYVRDTGLEGYVVFTGGVDYKSIPFYYKMAYVFAIASTTEVKPLVILEALAAGLPIVAVNAPGAADTLTDGHDGILTDVTRESLARGIDRLLKDRDLYEGLRRGALETAESYSIDRVSDIFLALYEELIKAKSR